MDYLWRITKAIKISTVTFKVDPRHATTRSNLHLQMLCSKFIRRKSIVQTWVRSIIGLTKDTSPRTCTLNIGYTCFYVMYILSLFYVTIITWSQSYSFVWYVHTCVYGVKFNDAYNVIGHQFVCGNVPVYHKIWWHALIDFNSSLSSTVQYCHHFFTYVFVLVHITYVCSLLL